jgi:hypothetical protein
VTNPLITAPPALLHELLAIVDLGPVTASTVAANLGQHEASIRQLLDEQVHRHRMKVSARPARYELTPEGRYDLAKERLIYAILIEFMYERAASIAGLRDEIASNLGLTTREVSEAATGAMADGWIAPTGPSEAYLAITTAGRQALELARLRWPRFIAPLGGRLRPSTA